MLLADGPDADIAVQPVKAVAASRMDKFNERILPLKCPRPAYKGYPF